MSKDPNLQVWTSCWKESNDEFSRLCTRDSPKLWDQRAEGFAQRLSPKKKLKRTLDVFDFLTAAGFQPKGARVLDIGCGPGRLAVPLAQAGARVTGLDVSAKGLDHLRANAAELGLNIETIQATWWAANIDKLKLRNRFDLVIASMTPAIKDQRMLEKMIACSKRFCFYSGFLRSMRRDPAEEAVRRILTGKNEKAEGLRRAESTSPFLFNFMSLYLSGYRPLVSLQHGKRRNVASWEDAAERAIRFYGVPAEANAPALRRRIRAYYKQNAIDGKLHSVIDIYTGSMIWDVKARR
jgi:SAM-dependent methyltransferase